ncbi:hypothetical protein VTN00DRAFT_6690 [Thermoascus crustaceus]|uniref:uncharacterized protein n=1 Tax=Thermoascus crustaceus TaxID=5088 RepID=UPI003743A4F6
MPFHIIRVAIQFHSIRLRGSVSRTQFPETQEGGNYIRVICCPEWGSKNLIQQENKKQYRWKEEKTVRNISNAMKGEKTVAKIQAQ